MCKFITFKGDAKKNAAKGKGAAKFKKSYYFWMIFVHRNNQYLSNLMIYFISNYSHRIQSELFIYKYFVRNDEIMIKWLFESKILDFIRVFNHSVRY